MYPQTGRDRQYLECRDFDRYMTQEKLRMKGMQKECFYGEMIFSWQEGNEGSKVREIFEMVNIIFDKKRRHQHIVARVQDEEPRNYYC